MEKSQESATESESERDRRLGLENECRIVKLQLFKRIAEISVLCTVRGINTRKNHRLNRLESGERLVCGVVCQGHGIADSCISNALDRRGDISDLACAQAIALTESKCLHSTDLDNVKFLARAHKSYLVAGAELSVHNANVYDDSKIAIIVRVKNQSLKGCILVARGRGNIAHYRLKHLLNIKSRLCRDRGTSLRGNSYLILDLLSYSVGVCARQVDLIDNGDDLKICIYRKICVCKRLRLYSLRCVNDEQCTVARVERARHLVVKVNVTGGVDEVEDVGLTVRRGIVELYRSCLDGYSPLLFKIHIVKDLLLHLAL